MSNNDSNEEPRINILTRLHHGEEGRLIDSPQASMDELRYFDEETDNWQDEREKTVCLLSECLGEVLGWLVKGQPSNKQWQESVARKTIAMIWAMRPDLLGNRSLRELCRMAGVNVTASSLSFHVSTFTKRFGHFHRGTKSDRARKAYSAARQRFLKQEKGVGP